MTLTEACNLAAIIAASESVQLIAIGRFLPHDQITSLSPWGCSVRTPGGQTQTVWSGDQWWSLIAPGTAPTSTVEARAPPRPDAHHRRQPSLF